MILKNKTKNKLLLFSLLLSTILILQLTTVSAALCKSPGGYYEDCGYDDNYYKHRSKQHLDYHYKDHVYEQKTNHYYKPTYIKTRKTLTYKPSVYYYNDRAKYIKYKPKYQNSYYKSNNYNHNYHHYSDYNYKNHHYKPHETLNKIVYYYEPAYDRPTYLVYKNTYRY